MKINSFFKSLFGVLLLVVSSISSAAIVSWSLENVTLSDGQSLTGGFNYDRDTNTFSDISIFNSGTAAVPSMEFDRTRAQGGCYFATCTFNDGDPFIGDFLLHLDWGLILDPTVSLAIEPSSFLSNDGGVHDLTSGLVNLAFFTCEVADCTAASTEPSSPASATFVTGNLVSTSTVPLPTGVWLFGSAIAGLVSVRIRRP